MFKFGLPELTQEGYKLKDLPQNTAYVLNKQNIYNWQFFVTFLGWLSDPFKCCW